MMGLQLRLHHSLRLDLHHSLRLDLHHSLRVDHPWECGIQPIDAPMKIHIRRVSKQKMNYCLSSPKSTYQEE